METVCRLCVSKPQIYVDVYENEGKSMKLAEKIAQCLQIWLYPEDPLPKIVCAQCVQKVNDTFLFFETCSKAQSTLHTLFNVPVVKRPGELTSSSAKSMVENSADDDDETSIKMEPGLDALTNFIQDNNKSRPVSTDNHLAVELKTSNLGAHPEDLLECLLENSETNGAVPATLHSVSKNGPNIGNEPSVKRKGKPPAKQAAVQKQTKKGGPGKTSKPTVSPEPSLERENFASDESENDFDCPPEDKSADRLPAVDWAEENACEADALNKKGKKASAPKKASGTKILEDYPWQCVVCDAMVQSLQDLKSHHENVHGQAPVFKCMQCSKVYNRYRSFSRHVKLHHNPKKFSCDICGKSFAQKTVLQSHSAVHSEERPFSCDQCGKRFKQFSSLYLHNKNHLPSSEREKFRCEHCDKEFASKHTLETHRKVHTGERNFICDICGKSFIAKGSLDYHILSHTGDKPHDCSVCGKCFKTARLLAKHVTLHSGIKPHQCDVCGKQFREKGALREHSRIHTGAMPYACDYCGKRFRFKGILTVHTRQHTGERPYACVECPRQFTNWANYNKHMKRRHRNADGNEQACATSAADTARRSFQSHPLGVGVASALSGPTSSCAPPSGLILQVPTYSSNGLPSVLPPNMSLLDSSGSALLMSAQQIQGGKLLSHGGLSHLAHSDLHSGQVGVPDNLLSAAFPSNPLAKDEDDEGDETSDEEDPDEHPDNEGQSLGALANPIEDHLEVELTDGTLNADGNNQVPRQLYVQDNSNSSNSMTVSSAFPPNYSNSSQTKMAVMFQSHHNNKITSMFYQDGACDSTNETNASMNMGSYHMNPYMSSGLPTSLPPSLPSGLTAMGNMGYYLQPLHGDHAVNAHQSHNMHVSHNRISNNQ